MRLAIASVAGLAWLVLAWLLLRDAVPDGLAVGTIDVEAEFGADLVEEARRFERVLLGVWALSQATLLVTLWIYVRRGAGLTRESAAGPIGTGMLLGMLGLGLVWLAQLPFGLVALWWERRHEVSSVGYLEWIAGDWLELGAAFTFVSGALVIVMFLARWLGDWWWIPGGAVFVATVAAFALVSPYLAETSQARDPALVREADALERAEGTGDIPLRIEDVSGDTSQANAYAAGFGPTRAIVLWDTLLDFPDGQVRVVLAHEIAHHAGRHIEKAVAWFALFAFPSAWLLMRVTRRRGGMGAPEAVPVALFVVALVSLATLPLQNIVSRGVERDADWRALDATADPDAARGLFRGFASSSLGDPNPPTWAYVLLQTHPTLAQRVAMVDAWEAREASSKRDDP
jgi:STE24 endopeptidase